MAEVIWSAVMDEKYHCGVLRTSWYTGELRIYDGNPDEIEDAPVLHRESVALLYGAKFGPDISDVHMWMYKCEQVVDGLAKEIKP